jgi:pyridinium-3,5-bisthiocarboxylic acid mononucleotide nickel chelatase
VIAYVEMIGGASGNMLLGALLDAGADLAALETALRTIPVDGWRAERQRVVKAGIAATYFDFNVPGEDHPYDAAHSHGAAHAHDVAHARDAPPAATRRLADVLEILARSGLRASQKERARGIYVRLAEAEAKVHGVDVAQIHFHEVGQIDAILDVAGACVALDLLGVERVYCSAFPVGRGSIGMAHGRYPNPPPATAELLLGAPTYDAGIDGELVTTTGAAILTALVEQPGLRPAFVARRIGYGAGRNDFALPNVLRVSLGEPVAAGSAGAADEVVVLEANLDDMQPQYFELALERVLAAGAYDVWLAPVTMKKLRPAVIFGALAPVEREAAVAHALLENTTTLGVRVRRERRYVLERSVAEVATEFGPVRVKTAYVDGCARRTLEYDDVARIARERGRPVGEVAARLEELLSRP